MILKTDGTPYTEAELREAREPRDPVNGWWWFFGPEGITYEVHDCEGRVIETGRSRAGIDLG